MSTLLCNVLADSVPSDASENPDQWERDLAPVIDDIFLAALRRRGVASLLPLQRRAIRETGLLHGRNLLVVAPASSGKTLVSEMALLRALTGRRRAIFLVPTRALAEEHYRRFEGTLSGLGLRVVCSTSERPENDAPVLAGRFDLLVAVYEKFASLLSADARPLAGVGAIAVDEIHMLADPERGAALDLLVTGLLRSPYAPQIVALAPELDRPERLASWMHADLLLSSARPRPLREGVLNIETGDFDFRLLSAQDGENPSNLRSERLARPEVFSALARRVEESAMDRSLPLSPEERSLLSAAAFAAGDCAPAILFAPTRSAACRWVRLLSGIDLGFRPAAVALASLHRLDEPGRISRVLAEALAAGMAVHNADLSRPLRAIVERAMDAGEVRLLVSTPTLALGVNLTALTVLHSSRRMGSPVECIVARASPRPASLIAAARGSISLPLGRARFADQGGRAARFGRGEAAGRSILVARCDGEARRLWRAFVDAPPEPWSLPPLATIDDGAVALHFLSGGLRRTPGNLSTEAAATFSAAMLPDEELPLSDPGRAFDSLERLRLAGLACVSEDGFWSATALGEIALRSGLTPRTMRRIVQLIAEGDPSCPARVSEFRWLFGLAMTPEGAASLAGLPFGSRRPPLPVPASLADDSSLRGHLAESLFRGKGGPSRREVFAWCAACALLDWSCGVPTDSIESRYHMYGGTLASAGESFSRFVSAAAGAARALQMDGDSTVAFSGLAERVAMGVDLHGLPIARLRIDGLHRERIAAVLAAGFRTPEELRRAPRSEIEALLGSDVAEIFLGRIRLPPPPPVGSVGPVSVTVASSVASTSPDSPHDRTSESNFPPCPLIEIHLQSPGLVYVNGRGVQLPPLGYDLLTALAARPGEVVTRAALYHRLWPDGGPEDQQLDAHRRRLLERLRPALGPRAGSAIEVLRGLGFRLTLPANRIRIVRETDSRESGCAGPPQAP